MPNFFAIGDGAGVTRGLAQAGASGVKVAQVISQRLREEEVRRSRPPKSRRLRRKPEQSPAQRVPGRGGARERTQVLPSGGTGVKRTLRRRGPGGRVGREGRPGDFGAAEVNCPTQQNTDDTGPPIRAAPYYLPLFIPTVIMPGRNRAKKTSTVQETHNELCMVCIQFHMQ